MKRFQDLIVAAAAVMCIVLIHEFGHYSVATLSGVSAVSFNVGIGPSLVSGYIGETQFNLRALPLGGYVSFIADADHAAALARTVEQGSQRAAFYRRSSGWFGTANRTSKVLILLAGVVNNFISVLVIAPILSRWIERGRITKSMSELASGIAGGSAWIGPIGLVKLLGRAFRSGLPTLVYVSTYLSIEIGFFNLLPIIGFDGYQILVQVINAVRSDSSSLPTMLLPIAATVLLYRHASNRFRRLDAALQRKKASEGSP